MPRLRVQERSEWRDVHINTDPFVIGRAADCDLQIESGYISRHHCEIYQNEDGFMVRDFGSSMGTELNGKMIESAELRFGDSILLAGKITVLFMADAAASMKHTETMRVITPDVHPEGERLLCLDGNQAGRSYSLNRDIFTVGRDETNDIHLPVDTISTFHAEILREGDHWVVRDLDSGNGTFVNGEQIDHRALVSGDVIRFDHINMRFENTHFKVDSTGTRVRGIPMDPQPDEAAPASISRMELMQDIRIETPSQRMRTIQGTPPPKRRPKDKSSLGWLILLLVVVTLILTAAGVGAWYVYDQFLTPETQVEAPPLPGANDDQN